MSFVHADDLVRVSGTAAYRLSEIVSMTSSANDGMCTPRVRDFTIKPLKGRGTREHVLSIPRCLGRSGRETRDRRIFPD